MWDRLREQRIKQPVDLRASNGEPRIGHLPAQTLDPRHHARKGKR
jgi:hypothetical protein